MANSRFYSSTAAVTALQVTANPSDVSIQVASSSGFPGAFPFTLCLDYGSANEELVDVTSGGPSVYTITRGRDGTSASTHNAGAVVRHVSSARDFTDSRTHEASTTGVHGVTGTFVDTSSAQTLTNKTMTNPTINSATVTGAVTATGATITGGTYASSTLNNPTVNGAALSGTLTGSPTLSGAPTFSGVPVFSAGVTINGDLSITGKVQSTESAVGNVVNASIVSGDTLDRYRLYASGKQEFGSGAAVRDVTLQRSGAGVLGLTGSLTASGGLNGLEVTTTATTWTAFTPTWSGVGTGTGFSLNVGWYWKLGKIVYFEVNTVWNTNGSGTTQISFALPSTPFRDGGGANTSRQLAGTGWASSTNTISPGLVMGQVAATGSGGTCLISMYDNTAFQGSYLTSSSGGTNIVVQGSYREA
jgi:hypothetical protein